jgi:type I restriction enzyme S subunit
MSNSDWKFVKLGDLIDITHGYAFKGEFFREAPPGDILLTPGNFAVGGGFKSDKLKYYVGDVPEDFILFKNDLLVTMTDLSKAADTLGYPALLPQSPKNCHFLHNQRLGKVIIKLENLLN